MTYKIGIIIGSMNADKRAPELIKQINEVMPASCTNVNFRVMVPGYWTLKSGTKSSYVATDIGRAKFKETWKRYAEGDKYDAFICYDVALAHHFMPARDAAGLKDTSSIAGMIIHEGKPILFVDDPLKTYGFLPDEDKAVAKWITKFHIKKLLNHLNGCSRKEKPVKFIIPTTIQDLKDSEALAAKAELIAFDIENSGGYISCIGFALEVNAPWTPVIVIPLMINLPESDGRYWTDVGSFNLAIDTIKAILENPVPKAAHNGAYDITHLFRYGIAPVNYIYDTMLMIHCTWPTVSRALYVGASMFLSTYRYWKDDGKDVGEDGKAKWQVPTTPEKTFRYWQYNGLDCANTLELCLAILELWHGSRTFPDFVGGYKHVWPTYIRELLLEFGPGLYMSMHGMVVKPERQRALKEQLNEEAENNLENLRVLVADPDYNPNSPPQTQELLYDVLAITPLKRKGRTTDKKILENYADEHPIYKDVIKHITKAKEPRNNASKYGDMPMKGGRWLYQMKASATTTRRYASSKNNMGYGTNMQNVPAAMREMACVDPGRTLLSIDYSQSDSYFVAFESGDPAMIDTVTDARDTHSVHVEFFFGHKYDDVVKGADEKAEWVVHPDTGVRQIIKKVSHGTNYDMGGATMLLNIRKPAALSMVRSLLGSKYAAAFMKHVGLDPKHPPAYYADRARLLGTRQLEAACEFAQALYYLRYPKAKIWKKHVVNDAIRDYGVIEMYGGSYTVMLCPPAKNPRFVPAAKGQGGTAGNINNAMIRLYFLCQDMWDRGFRMVIQVHDELVTSIPDNQYDLVDRQCEVMEIPCEIRGQQFVVPVEAELSKTWSKKKTVKWKGLSEKSADQYLREVNEIEEKINLTMQPKGIL